MGGCIIQSLAPLIPCDYHLPVDPYTAATPPPATSPRLQILVKELMGVSADWKLLGTLLGVPSHILNGIVGRPANCLLDTLEAWINTGEADYTKLVNALYEIGQIRLAKSLAKEHGEFNNQIQCDK